MARSALFVEWLGVLVDGKGAPLPGVADAVRRFALRDVQVIAVDHRAGVTDQTVVDGVLGPVRPPAEGADGFMPPRPGLILRAAKQHDAELSSSWLIGTTPAHAHAAAQAGCAGYVLIGILAPPDDLGIVGASARDLADAPRVMIPRGGGCWH